MGIWRVLAKRYTRVGVKRLFVFVTLLMIFVYILEERLLNKYTESIQARDRPILTDDRGKLTLPILNPSKQRKPLPDCSCRPGAVSSTLLSQWGIRFQKYLISKVIEQITYQTTVFFRNFTQARFNRLGIYIWKYKMDRVMQKCN